MPLGAFAKMVVKTCINICAACCEKSPTSAAMAAMPYGLTLAADPLEMSPPRIEEVDEEDQHRPDHREREVIQRPSPLQVALTHVPSDRPNRVKDRAEGSSEDGEHQKVVIEAEARAESQKAM